MIGKNRGDVGRGRQDRLIKERVHDPYRAGAKPAGPVICPDCGVVFADGRWQWSSDEPDDAERALCPACRRVRDDVPAGILTLGGDFFAKHRDEIMRLVHNKVESQKAEHPMKRIMRIDDRGRDQTVITFTDMHLPRGVGQAIENAYEGELDIQYTEGANIVRVFWER